MTKTKQIEQFISEQPGYTVPVIADKLGINRNTVIGVTWRLKKEGRIKTKNYGKRVLYYAQNAQPKTESTNQDKFIDIVEAKALDYVWKTEAPREETIALKLFINWMRKENV